MTRFIDPLGFVSGTWNWMNSHGGGGFAALVAVLVVVLLHLLAAAAALIVVFNPGRFLEAVRGFAQGVRDNEPGGPVRV